MGDRIALEAELEYVKNIPGFKKTNPQFFADSMIDKLIEVVLLLGGEIWSNRDRQMVMEYLLATQGRVTPDLIETFTPDDNFKARAEAQRLKFIKGVFSGLYSTPDPAEDRDFFKAWTKEHEQQNDSQNPT